MSRNRYQSTIELMAYDDGYKQGKADAIDEFAKYIDKHSHISADGCEICLDDDVTILAEQMIKEQTDDNKS